MNVTWTTFAGLVKMKMKFWFFPQKYIYKIIIFNIWTTELLNFILFYRCVLSTPTLFKYFQSFINFEFISRWNVVKKNSRRVIIFTVQCTIKSWNGRALQGFAILDLNQNQQIKSFDLILVIWVSNTESIKFGVSLFVFFSKETKISFLREL